ncbi:Uncharacterized protein FWK35_00012683 [Aphis craccivora]|uniref:Uncharacterized protein n=1 Tax=Aphis craccivora TaxID=307492 RepID=A0A6G0YJA6_APHCR|nr:Uncharacterized protein FWK35_00012683 [Aphis craccivora]
MPFAESEFIAYDCDGPVQNFTSFDSLEEDNCEFPIPSKIQQVPRIQLLERIETYPVHFKSCFISVDYLITSCSVFEDVQSVYSDVVELGNARCWEIHQKRSYTFPLGGIVTDLQINETTLVSHTVAGSLDIFGNCKGTNFKSNRGEWENAIVQAKYKIYLSEGTAIANSKDNTLILPSGTKMKLSDNYGVDTFKGETVWSNNHYNCEEQDFIVLYDGPASLVTSTTNDNSNIYTYIVETDKIVFALKQIKKTFACEFPVIQTEHMQLLILTDAMFLNNFQTKSISPQITDLIAYINTKFVYVKNVFKSTITALHNDLLQKQCILERQLLQQRLTLASNNLPEFAYIMGGGPGFTAIKYAGIVYLIKCKKVSVEVTKTDSCYNELPVLYNNQTFYMAPKTHSLQKYGTQINCNSLYPPAFNLDGNWYGFSPNVHEIKTPQKLKPNSAWTWTHKNLDFLMNSGIYNTKDTTKAFQQRIIYPQEVEAVKNNIVRQSMGYNTVNQGIQFKYLIDEQTLGKMVEDKLYKLWGWFTTIGTFVSGLMVIFFVANVIVTTIDTGINIHFLYQTFGWSTKLLAGFFASLTNKIILQNFQRYKNKTNVYPNLQNEMV